MSLPPAELAAAGTYRAGVSPLAVGGESGGEDPGLPPSPYLYLSGGDTQPVKDAAGRDVPGQFRAESKIPIGTVAHLYIEAPIQVQAWTWTGGTEYSMYDIGEPSGLVSAVEVRKNVETHGSQYFFVVDKADKTFTITVSVIYKYGQGSASSTLVFDSTKPQASLSVAELPKIMTINTVADATISIGNTHQGSQGIAITASTDTTPQTNGWFMFVQVVNSVEMSYTGTDGKIWYKKNDASADFRPNGKNFNGPLLDTVGGHTAYGPLWLYSPYPCGDKTCYNKYSLNSSVLAWKGDTPVNNDDAHSGLPTLTDTPTYTVKRADLPKEGAAQVQFAATFSTYLMYRPETDDHVERNSVWIAIARIDWKFDVKATVTPGGVSAPSAGQPIPEPIPVNVAGGDAAFPRWVNTGNYAVADPPTHWPYKHKPEA